MQKKSVIYVSSLIIIAVLFLSVSALCNILTDAKNAVWSVYNLENLNKLFTSETVVAKFLQEVEPTLDDSGATVDQYVITNLGSDDRVQLIASVDVTGRKLYNTIYVVSIPDRKNFVLQELWTPGVNVTDLKDRIVEGPNGTKMFLLPKLVSTKPYKTEDIAYSWDGEKLVEVRK